MATVEKKNQQPPIEEDDYSSSGDDYSYDDYDDYDYSEEEYSDEEDPQSQSQKQLQRRQQPQQQQQQQIDPNYKGMKTASPQSERKSMQPFEHIGPPETSMDGPVTYARAQRGEIPMREGNPNQKLQTAENHQSPLDEEEGLKLKLELNLDVEVELKASIHGDLTLALLS